MLHELGKSPSRISRTMKRGSHSRSSITSLHEEEDIELMTLPEVVGGEAGERDPLLLRNKIVSDEDINGLRQCVDPAPAMRPMPR